LLNLLQDHYDRSCVCLSLVLVTSARITHSNYQREFFCFGWRLWVLERLFFGRYLIASPVSNGTLYIFYIAQLSQLCCERACPRMKYMPLSRILFIFIFQDRILGYNLLCSSCGASAGYKLFHDPFLLGPSQRNSWSCPGARVVRSNHSIHEDNRWPAATW
jgi:hypothetical protein